MSETPGASDPSEAIQRDIERTREEMGDTVEALAAKTDVKAQAKRKAEETKASVQAKKDEMLGKAKSVSPDSATQAVKQNPLPTAAVGAFAAGFLFGRLTKR